MDGGSVIVSSPTGSGKTLAVVVPMITSLVRDRLQGATTRPRRPRAVLLFPTRELASQALSVIRRLLRPSNREEAAPDTAEKATLHALTAGMAGGSRGQSKLNKALRTGLDILVGTPHGIQQLALKEKISLSDVQWMVVDEGDVLVCDEGEWTGGRHDEEDQPSHRDCTLWLLQRAMRRVGAGLVRQHIDDVTSGLGHASAGEATDSPTTLPATEGLPPAAQLPTPSVLWLPTGEGSTPGAQAGVPTLDLRLATRVRPLQLVVMGATMRGDCVGESLGAMAYEGSLLPDQQPLLPPEVQFASNVSVVEVVDSKAAAAVGVRPLSPAASESTRQRVDENLQRLAPHSLRLWNESLPVQAGPAYVPVLPCPGDADFRPPRAPHARGGRRHRSPGLHQDWIQTAPSHKPEALMEVLGRRGLRKRARTSQSTGSPAAGQAIVFCNSVTSARFVGRFLEGEGYDTVGLHGGIPPKLRLSQWRRFRSGEVAILVTTDAGARGLDLLSVDLVVQFDMARSSVDHMHRIGRCARAGRSGTAIQLVTGGELRHARDKGLVSKPPRPFREKGRPGQGPL